MKRKKSGFIALALLLAMAATTVFTGCGSKELSGQVDVAALNGPTGMGMVEMMDDENVNITTYQAPEEVVSKIVSGEVDMAAVPSNLASVLYNKTKGNIVAITTLTSGVLYIVQNGKQVTELNQLMGKTIVASGKGGTPEYVLDALLEKAGLNPQKDVNIKWLANHSDVAQQVASGKGTIALLPEPFVSVVTTKNKNLQVAFDLNDSWKEAMGTGLPMGVLIAKKTFVQERADDLEVFLDALNNSVETVNTATDDVAKLIVDKGFISDTSIAKNAIPRCNISCLSPEYNRTTLEGFLKALYEIEPSSVGGKLPNEDFYY